MLAYMPHLVEVYQPQDVSGALTPAIEDVAPKTRGARLRCLIYPESVEDVFKATGIEMAEPWRLFCNACDANLLAQGAHVIHGNRRLVVRTRPQIHDAPLGASHATVRLEALAREPEVLV